MTVLADINVNRAGLATYAVPPTNRSVTLTGASQTLMPANPQRRDFFIENTGANVVYVNVNGGTADALGKTSIMLAAGAAISGSLLGEMVPKGQINVIGTNGQPLYAHETFGYPQRA